MANRDQQFMSRALEIASRVPVTAVTPNPLVGAVIVKGGKIIGEGVHEKFGDAHAEINALRSCRISPKGAVMYVTLEPCCHWGKTPPCTDAIIKSGVTRIVCAVRDPNPLVVKEKGIKALRQKGIEVKVGICSNEAKAINEPFFHFYRTGRPFLATKIASSLDGKIATRTGDSKWITSQEARDYARTKIRSEYQAILVGVNTVLKDNPHLGIRRKGVPDPLRIILDSQLRTPLSAQAMRDANVILIVGSAAPKSRFKGFGQKGFAIMNTASTANALPPERGEMERGVKSRGQIWRFPSRDIPIPQLLKKLAEQKITSVLVEGGGETIGRFLDADAVQKVYWFHAPLIIGGNDAAGMGGKGISKITQALQLKNINRIPFGRDLLTIGYAK